MAEKYEKFRIKKRESNLRLPTPAGEAGPTTYDPARQVEGLTKRLEASGIDVEKATDDRNIIEKTLNLTEDQNILFDIFEILGRPQQAIFNGIKSVQEGGSFGEGFKSGLSGDNYTTFSSILNEAGLGEEDAFGVDDVLGFIGDVLLDPVDLGIMVAGVAAAPITGGASTAAAAGTIATVNAAQNAASTTAKVMQALKKAGAAGTRDLVQTVKNIGSRVKATTKTTAKFYGELGTNIAKGQLKEAGKMAFKSTIKLADGTVVRKIGITDMTMQAFGGLIKKGGKAVNWTVRTGIIESFAENPSTYVQTWDNWLTAMKGQFNAAARLGEKLFTEAQIAGNKASFGLLFGDAWTRKVKGKIDNIVEDTYNRVIQAPDFDGAGKTAKQIKEEIRESVNKELLEFGELKYNPETTVSEVLNNPYKYELPIDDKVKAEVVRAINTPAFRSVKGEIANSATRGKLYERQTRVLTSALANNQQSIIDNLNLQKKQLLDKTQPQAAIPLSPAEQARQFVEGAGAGAPIEDLGQVMDGTAGLERALSPEDTLKLGEINEQIRLAQGKLDFYKGLGYNESGYNAARREIQELINSGSIGPDDAQVLESIAGKTQKAIDDDGFNLFDELFEETTLPGTDKTIYVMRKDKQTESIVNSVNERIKKISEIISYDNIDGIKKSKRFLVGSDTETEVRKLIQETGFDIPFEELFIQNGDIYEMSMLLENQDAVTRLLGLARPEDLMSNSISGARFLTDDEFAELGRKYQPGFANEAAYTDVMNDMEEAMRWYDKQYGTAFAQDVKGYIRHTVTQEAKDFLNLKYAYNQVFGSPYDATDSAVLIGNTRTFKGRKYEMTVAEANRIAKFNTQRVLEAHAAKPFLNADDLARIQDRATQNLFGEYFTDSFQDTLINMNKYGSAINVMNTALVAGALEGKDIVRFASPLEKVPAGFVKVEKKAVRDKVKQMTTVFKDNKGMQDFIENFIDAADDTSVALIDENVFKMIGRLGQPKDVKLFTQLMEQTNNFFKKNKVFSLGFHFKNLIGNAANLYLAGVSPTRIPIILVSGINARKKAVGLIDTFAEILQDPTKLATLLPNPKDQKIFKAYQIFMDGGFDEAGKYLFDLDELIKKNGDRYLSGGQLIKRGAKKVTEGQLVTLDRANPGALTDLFDGALKANVDINNMVDGGYRLGYIMDLIEEKTKATGRAVLNAEEQAEIIQKVKLALFDPSSLTAAEEGFKKYIPFYTFAKKNLAFQMKNVFENPVKYSRFIKGVKSSWSAIGVDWREDLQGYQKDNLWLPIPLTMKDGKYFQLKTSFPLSDLGEYLENPAQKIFSSLTPLVRAPIEMTMNQQFFSGQPIERFEGQRGRMLGDLGFSAKTEFLLGQTGADRPLIAAASVIDLLSNRDARTVAPTVYSQGDVAQAQRSRAYDQLDELRGLFQYYKQEEIPILQLSEIENLNKPRSNIAQRLQSIQSRRGR